MDGRTVKAFVCPDEACQRVFARRSNRSDHVRRIHKSLWKAGTFGGDAVDITKQDAWKIGDKRCAPRLRLSRMERSRDDGLSCSSGGGSGDADSEVKCIGDRVEALDGKVEKLTEVVRMLVGASSLDIRELVSFCYEGDGSEEQEVRSDGDEVEEEHGEYDGDRVDDMSEE